MEGGCEFVNHCGNPLFPLLDPTKTNCVDPFNQVYDDIDMYTIKDEPSPQGVGADGGAKSLRATQLKEMIQSS